MNVVVKAEKGIFFSVTFSFILVFGAFMLFWKSMNAPVASIIFLIFCLPLLVNYAIAVCRVFVINKEGICVSFLCFSRQFRWHDLKTNQTFDCSNSLGYLVPYRCGYEFWHKKTKRPEWMQPIVYSLLFCPFSYVVIHRPFKGFSDFRYLAIYECDSELLDVLVQGYST